MFLDALGDKTADWAAVVMAGFALGATTWQAAITRRHNKLSVTPMLMFHHEKNITTEGTHFKFVIKNVGIGVATVTDRYFTVKGQRYSPKDPKKVIKEICNIAIGQVFQYAITSEGLFGPKAKIPAGAEITLLAVFFPGMKAPELHEVVETLAEKVDFVVEYKSIYGEKYSSRDDE